MYEITVERSFSAAHAIGIGGRREPVHGHDWHVTVTVEGRTLDDDGLLCDFHTVGRTLKDICRPFENRHLNELAPFDRVNPTAEQVARHIADELCSRLDEALAPHARVSAVRVTEAVGCAAIYRPEGSTP